tara:strand:+ start:1299 stop:2300 length:1002 start_codon:yes stop_codon:yes gene_type:complete
MADAIIRILRNSTNANPPASLAEGELAVNVFNDPPTLYVGDGTTVLDLIPDTFVTVSSTGNITTTAGDITASAGDITVSGAVNGGTLVITSTASISGSLNMGDNLFLPDNVQAIFGTDNNMRVYYDGTDTLMRVDSLIIKSGNGLETQAVFTANAGVDLYYNDVKTIETLVGGAKITGDLEVTGDITGNVTGAFVTATAVSLQPLAASTYEVTGLPTWPRHYRFHVSGYSAGQQLLRIKFGDSIGYGSNITLMPSPSNSGGYDVYVQMDCIDETTFQWMITSESHRFGGQTPAEDRSSAEVTTGAPNEIGITRFEISSSFTNFSGGVFYYSYW